MVFLGASVLLWAQTEAPKSEPVKVSFDLKRVNADTVSISLKMTKGDKPFAASSLSEAPAFTIFDEKGNKLTEDKFKFG